MSIPRPKSPAILLICAMGLVGAGGCAASSPEGLRRAVRDFNRSLRWQRFARASRYLETSRQDSFLQRYSAAEDLLHIQSMAVQRVRTRRDDAAVNAQVTVVARYYLLPSTVVEEARIRQQIGRAHV